MSWRDRPYARHDFDQSGPRGPGGGMGISFPRPTPAVKAMLLINVAVFVLQAFLDSPSRGLPMSRRLGVTVAGFWQLWRYVTSQFLHGGFWHIVLNMLGLYILGSPLERHWGTRRFVKFYLTCGAAAGLAYVIIGTLFDLNPNIPIIGASGGVFGVVLACAVLFPQFMLILYFFPVPIRLIALIIFGGMIYMVVQALVQGQAGAAMSHVAHLGGAVAGAVWIWVIPRLVAPARTGGPRGRGRWERKLKQRRGEEEEINRILDKIRREGIGSLSWKEKRKLQQATDRERKDGGSF